MNKKLIGPILNIIAMSLVMISCDEFDWLAIGALIIMVLSIVGIVYTLKNTHNNLF